MGPRAAYQDIKGHIGFDEFKEAKHLYDSNKSSLEPYQKGEIIKYLAKVIGADGLGDQESTESLPEGELDNIAVKLFADALNGDKGP